MSRYSLYLFGSPRLEVNGQPVNTDRRKALALLAYLAVNHQPHTREALAALFWPDYDPGKAFAYLRRTLWELNQLLGEGVVLAERETVELNPQAEVWLDVIEFWRCLTQARSAPASRQSALLRALELYQVDFLSNFHLKDAPDFDEWQFLETENLRRDLAGALQTLVDLDLADGGEPDRAITLARRWLALDSFDETAQRALMRAYAQAGQTAAAIRQYQECARILQAELKTAPQPETTALFEQIKASKAAPTPSAQSTTARTNLPRALTPFIGRAQLVADLAERFTRVGERLITLTGSGGMGKTRLALEVAKVVQLHYPHGVWFIDLAPLSDPLLVPQAVAATLEARRQPDRPVLNVLIDHVRDKHLLLVLDNCEHLIDACAQLADQLLQHCPQLHVLATSREALGIQGESSVRVPSLSLPPIEQPAPEVLARSEAVQLFLDRARAALPDFELTATNASAIMQICRRLDGIALAIELAASRVKLLTVEQIAARLDDAFHLLTGGSRTALPRQQTLIATIDWSYNLLTDHERVLLRRLAVFAGGWTLEAAEAIGAGDDLERYEILDLLTQLVNKSLVVVEQTQLEEARFCEARYHLLDTIRQYAREKFAREERAANDDNAAVRQRHVLFFLQLAERAEPELQRSDQAAWFNRLDVEYDNLRAALDWACLTNDEAGLQLGRALRQYWGVRYWSEGRQWLTRILALPVAQPRTTARASVLNGAAYLAHMQGDAASAERLYEESTALWREAGDISEGLMHALRVYGNSIHYTHDKARGRALIEESLALARAAGNQAEMAWSLFDLGQITRAEGQPAAARTLFEESLALHRAVQNPTGQGLVLNALGEDAVERDELQHARALLEESLYFYRQAGDKRGLATSSATLARAAWLQHDLPRAMQLSAESLALTREIGFTDLTGWLLGGLGWMALQQQDTRKAEHYLAEALELLHGNGQRDAISFCMSGMAGVAAAASQFERAATLLGKAQVLRDLPPWPPIAPDIERLSSEIPSHLSEAEFAAAWSRGQAMSDEQAIVYALKTSDASA
jgi:predicted ATPase/DNA-binding SARP family transcriptional activator